MKNLSLTLGLWVLGAAMCAAEPIELNLSSPEGTHKVKFYEKKSASGANVLCYEVNYNGKQVVKESQAGLQLDNRVWEMALGMRKLPQPACWMDNLEVDSVAYGSHDATWTPLYGERSSVRDNYKWGTLYLSKKDGSDYRLNVEVRAYDEGVAFRYYFPEHPKAIFHKVVGDLTEYTFPEGTKAWAEQWAQAHFEYLDVNALKKPVERALTLELPNGVWAALTDADVDGAHISPLLLTFIYRFMPELIKQGYVYLAQPPLYKIEKNKRVWYAYSDEELNNILKEIGRDQNNKIQRYKGLGEMDAEQLWETTLNPATRMLKRIEIEDGRMASDITELLMGNDVPPRKTFIYEHAHDAELDV